MSEGQHKVLVFPTDLPARESADTAGGPPVAGGAVPAVAVEQPASRSGTGTTPLPRIYGEASGMRVLVVDDEVDLAKAVGRGLRREGYAVDVVHSGEDALDRLAYTPYDLVCLDLTMPGIDGIEVCRTIRQEYGAEPRVLMLTARDAVADRVAGLDEGADDYLVKPFALPELLARVRLLLRRDTGQRDATLRVGPLQLDTARHEAWRGERRLELTAKEFALLRYFMTHPGEVLSQERLLEHVWDENADPFTNTVRVTVGTLRRKLTIDDEIPVLETVVGSGYRLQDGA